MEGKFSEEIETLKKKQTEMLKMKEMVDQIRTIPYSIANRQDYIKKKI